MFWDLAAQAQAQAAQVQAPAQRPASPAPLPVSQPGLLQSHAPLQSSSVPPDLALVLAQQAQASQLQQAHLQQAHLQQAQLHQAQLQQAQQQQAQQQYAQYQAQLQQHAQAQAQAQLQAQIAAQQAQAQREAEAKRQADAQAQANAMLQAQLAAQAQAAQAQAAAQAQVHAQLHQARLNALAQAQRPPQAGPLGLSIGQRPQWPSFRPNSPTVVRPPGGNLNRPLTQQQKEIRDGDFQVRQAAGQRAAEQVQEALDNATFAQKRLAEATKKAEDCLEKAQQSQQYQQKSRSPDAAGAGGLNFQQQQVWMQTVSNELFNEAGGIGDQILAMAESAIDATRRAAQKVYSAADPLLGLAKKAEHVTRVNKAQQLGYQADAMAQSSQASVGAARERLQAARDARDVSALLAACQAMKAAVTQASLGAGSVFQASQLAQHAAPAVRTAGGVEALQGKTTTAMPGPERELLPIDDHQDEIVKTINERRVTCIQGETGCGKSSRVPQYVYFFCRKNERRGSERIIVCTQPRRLAALTLAQRVANEMGESTVGGLVGYRMSGDSAVDRSRTKLLFVTTGYLLQVLVNDPSSVRNYSHIILDEAHERSVDADLLSLVLKLQVQHKLADFKIIIMSATLQGGIFSRYFQDEGEERSPPPPIFVGVKRFNLDMMYLDDLAGLCSSVDRGDVAASTLDELRQHTGLSLTKMGQEALNNGMDGFRHVIQKLQMRTQVSNLAAAQASSLGHLMGAAGMPGEAETEFWRINADPSTTGDAGNPKSNIFVKPQVNKGFEYLALELVRILGCGGEGILIFLPGIGEISEFYDCLEILEHPLEEQQLAGLTQQRRSPCEYKIFVLHSTIPMDEQEQAFHQPPDNVCHVFLASTIAESSVTLPKVRVVIDFSLRRQMAHDRTRHGLQCLLTQWVSHASASQRSGRAGRVFPGVSIRMVPRAFYNQVMPQYDPPEIEQAPLEKLYLNVKQLSHRIREKMPRIGALPPRQLLQLTVQPPPTERLEEAVHTLAELGALTTRSDETARITVLGRMAIALPLDLRLCRLVLFGVLFGCAADAVVMAAALSGQDPFTLPISMVIKDHWKFARAIMRSSEARRHFDRGSLSEPIMLRNLFVEWLQGLQLGAGPDASPRFVQSGSTQRYVFVKRATEFSHQYAVMPKRLTQMALAVVDVAQRTMDFLEPSSSDTKESPARIRLESLLSHLGVQAVSKNTAAGSDKPKAEEVVEKNDTKVAKNEDTAPNKKETAEAKVDDRVTKDAMKDGKEISAATPTKTQTGPAGATTPLPLHDVFAEDMLLLKAAITASFSPLYAHGVVRCVDYTSKIGGPMLSLKGSAAGEDSKTAKQASPVVIPAEGQVAKLVTQMIHDPDDLLGGPLHSFCIPHCAEIFQQHPDTWAHSLRDFTSAGTAKFKKLHILDKQAFFTYEQDNSATDVVSEADSEEDVCPPESLMAQAAEDHESSGDEYVRQRAESSDSESGNKEGIKKARRKRAKKRASEDQSGDEEASKRMRKDDEEASAAENPSEAAGSERGKIQVKWKTTRAKLNAGEVAEETQQEGAEADEEDSKGKAGKDKQGKKEKSRGREKDKEKDQEKEGEEGGERSKAKEKKEKAKVKGKVKEKEKEKSKKAKEKEKGKRSRSRSKKRRVERSKSRDSSKEQRKRSRSKDKKKRSGSKERKRSRSKDRKEAAKKALKELRASDAIAPASEGQDAAVLEDELALEAAEVSVEDAFEGLTEEQREKQRRRLERFRAMQDAKQSAASDASKSKKLEVKVATGGSEHSSVLAKLQARAEEETKIVYKVGDKIEVKLMPDEGGNEQWHAAEVIGHNADGTMNIIWEQDGTEDCCAPDEARPREAVGTDSEEDDADDRPKKKHKAEEELDPKKKAVEQAKASIEEKRKLLAEKDATLMELLKGTMKSAPALDATSKKDSQKKRKLENGAQDEKVEKPTGKQAKSGKEQKKGTAKEEASDDELELFVDVKVKAKAANSSSAKPHEEDYEDEILKQLKASAKNAKMDASFAEFMSEVNEIFKEGTGEKLTKPSTGKQEGNDKKPKSAVSKDTDEDKKAKQDKDELKKGDVDKKQDDEAELVEVVDLESDEDTKKSKKNADEDRKKKAGPTKDKQAEQEKAEVEEIDLSSDEPDDKKDGSVDIAKEGKEVKEQKKDSDDQAKSKVDEQKDKENEVLSEESEREDQVKTGDEKQAKSEDEEEQASKNSKEVEEDTEGKEDKEQEKEDDEEDEEKEEAKKEAEKDQEENAEKENEEVEEESDEKESEGGVKNASPAKEQDGRNLDHDEEPSEEEDENKSRDESKENKEDAKSQQEDEKSQDEDDKSKEEDEKSTKDKEDEEKSNEEDEKSTKEKEEEERSNDEDEKSTNEQEEDEKSKDGCNKSKEEDQQSTKENEEEEKSNEEDEKSTKEKEEEERSNEEDEKSTKEHEEDEKSKEEERKSEKQEEDESSKDADEKSQDDEADKSASEKDDNEKDSEEEDDASKNDEDHDEKDSAKQDEKSEDGSKKSEKEDEKSVAGDEEEQTRDEKAVEEKNAKAGEGREAKASEAADEKAGKETEENPSQEKDDKASKEKAKEEAPSKKDDEATEDEIVKGGTLKKEEGNQKTEIEAKDSKKEEDDDFADFLNEIQSLDNSEAAAKKAEAADASKPADGKEDKSNKAGDAPDASKDSDFMNFLNELEDLEKAPQPPVAEPEPEEEEDAGEDLYKLPEVELKRRIRTLGAKIPAGMHRKDELVELLQEAEAKKAGGGDAMADFLGEIGNLGEGEQKNPDAAFEAFMNEIDQMPGIGVAANISQDDAAGQGALAQAYANTSVKGSKPLTITFMPERRAWVVSVGHGFGERDFHVDGPGGAIQARREALQYCQQKLKDLESGDLLSTSVEKTRDELQRLVSKAQATEDAAEGKTIDPVEQVCRGLDFHAMHLLYQVAGGKGTFLWPFRQRQQFAGNKGMKEYTAEVEQKFEVSRPAHPFQLSWRVCLDRTMSGSASFGTGNFRNPTGLVVSCPSKPRIEQLRAQHQKRAQENAELQKRLKQEHQQALSAAMAVAATPEAAAEAAQKVAAQVYSSASAAAAESARAKDSDSGWARRLERFAVFCGAQGREDRSGHLQLEGLTVLNNEDGSNALPILMMLAFMRPRVCGGAVAGGCSVLCDLDTMRVRAVSMFGHSAETRWILPLTGKRRLMLDDLKHVNTLRNAVSAAFAVVDDEDSGAEPTAAQTGSGGGPYIREDPEIGRALGILLAEVGQGPSPFELEADAQAASPISGATPGSMDGTTAAPASKEVAPVAAQEDATDASAPKSKPKRELGDVWINLEEDGTGLDEVDTASFVRWDAPLPKQAKPRHKAQEEGEAVGGFFSFDAPVENLNQEAAEEEAKKKAEAEAAAAEAAAAEEKAKAEAEAAAARAMAPSGEPARFAFLPELGLPKAFAERVESFRSMQVEAKDMVTEGKQAMKIAEQLVRTMKDTARKVDSTMESARHAWNMAMNANTSQEAHRAMDRAVRTMQEVGVTISMLTDMAKEVEQMQRLAGERESRAASCNETAPHIWNAAIKKTKVHKGKLNFQWNLTSNALQRAEVSKRTAMMKADDTIRLVNDKLRRWEDERLILLEEAQMNEQWRQQEAQRQHIAVLEAQRQAQIEMQRQQQELARQQIEMERQRMQAIHWGRNMVQPIEGMQFLEHGSQSSPANAAPPEETAPPPPPDDNFAGASEPPPPPEDAAPGPPPPPEDGVTAPPPPPDDGTLAAPPPGPPPDAPPPGSTTTGSSAPPAGWLFGAPSPPKGQRR